MDIGASSSSRISMNSTNNIDISSGCSRCCRRFGRWWFNCFRRWRMWIRPFVMLCYAVVLMVIVPLLFYNCLGADCSNQQRTQFIGGVFALLALPVTFWEITQHLVHYTKPYLQKHVIRILWMVPVYALDAWLGLLYPEYSIYANSFRECYEAYVIYNFMIFLLNYLNTEMDLETNLELKPQVHHLVPLCCMKDWEMGRQFVHNCKHGILQYTVIRPLTTFIALYTKNNTIDGLAGINSKNIPNNPKNWLENFQIYGSVIFHKNRAPPLSVCHQFDVYGEGEFKVDKAYPYVLAVNNVSQFAAMYCLVLFYKANKDELGPMRPIGKFLCIKAVVFFSFFQGVAITILSNTGLLTNVFGTTSNTNPQDISSSLEIFLICIEMFLAAIAHHYAFSYKAYVDMAAEQPNCCHSFCLMWDVSDVKKDLEEHIGVYTTTVRNVMPTSKVYKHPGGMREERAHLLSTSDGVDYNSGDSGVSTTSSLPRPLQAARSASLQLIAEMDGNANNSKDYNERQPDPDSQSAFMDLSDTED